MNHLNPKAFPDSNVTSGMTLRDWFAGQAFSGAMSTLTGVDEEDSKEWAIATAALAKFMYIAADAMLAARGDL